jgi:hypothetical protein
LVSWIDGDGVVVADPAGGQATIRSSDGVKFQYKRLSGDPLKLGDLPDLIDGRENLEATSDGKCEFPDPLYRLWRAHFGIAQNTADVLVSLDDGYYNGAGGFAGAVKMASTHGGLNFKNSATFIMSSAGPIPGPLRSGDIPAELSKLLGRPFPRGK